MMTTMMNKMNNKKEKYKYLLFSFFLLQTNETYVQKYIDCKI